MKKALRDLPPEAIVCADDPSLTAPRRGERLFDAVGDTTAALVVDGTVLVASLWESAWKAGGGEQLPKARIAAVSEAVLSRIVRSGGFVPSRGIGALG